MSHQAHVGVAIPKCFYCQKDKNEILIGKRLYHEERNIVSKMHGKIVDMSPCTDCEGWMRQGVILITIDPALSSENWNKADIPNPYRTGGFFVIKEEALERMLCGDSNKRLLESALKHRFMFMEHEAAEQMGFFETVTKEN